MPQNFSNEFMRAVGLESLKVTSLLFVGSLTGNINGRSVRVLCALCTMRCVLTIQWVRGEKTFLRKSRGRESTFAGLRGSSRHLF